MKQIVIKFVFFTLFIVVVMGVAFFVGSFITNETALVLHLKIVEAGEDEQAHWFIVELQDTETKERLDADRFRFAKQIKHTEFADIEVNRFDYQELATTASRHFLKRQGKIAKDSPWEPASIIKISGANIVEEETLAVRRTRMVGAELRIEIRDISGILVKLDLSMGTITTISADFDGLTADDRGIFCDDTSTTMDVGILFADSKYRSYARFPLSSISSNATITDVDVRVNVTSLSGALCFAPGFNQLCVDVQAYNQDGQADPEADTCDSTRYARVANDSTPYIDDFEFESTGITTLQLPSDANTDVQNALGTANRFSIAFNEQGSDLTGTSGVGFETIENAGGDEFKLIITHTSVSAPSPDTTTPEPIQDFAAASQDDPSSPSGQAVLLTWTNSSDSDFKQVRIYRSTESSFTPSSNTEIAQVPGFPSAFASYLDTNIEPGVTYTYLYQILTEDIRGNLQAGLFYPSVSILTAAPAEEVIEEEEEAEEEVIEEEEEPITQPSGIITGDLIRGPDNVRVYLVNEHGYKRHVFNPAIFNLYGYDWQNIKEVSQEVLDAFAESTLYRVVSFSQTIPDPRVFSLEEIDEAAGIAIPHHLDVTPERFEALGYDWRQVFLISEREHEYYRTGEAL